MLQRSRRATLGALVAALLLVPALLLVGCVERKLVVLSEPAGAVVLLDNKVVGKTPFETPFVHYGGHIVEVRWDPFEQSYEERFETMRQERFLYPPVYQWFPIDFAFEYLNPFTITDERVFQFELKRVGDSRPDPNETEQVIRRSETMRGDVLRGEG